MPATANRIDLENLLRLKVADKRDLPCYSIGDAANFLDIPLATMRAWVCGTTYKAKPSGETRRFKSILTAQRFGVHLLTFRNLVEAHVLNAIRRTHGVSMRNVRKAVEYLRGRYTSKTPFADYQLSTDKVSLFIEEYGKLINLSQNGQLEMKAIIDVYLQRIERDPQGVAQKLYPFTRTGGISAPSIIEIDPSVSFGRPTLRGTGIPTDVIASLNAAGAELDAIARDYHLTPEQVNEAVEWEKRRAA
jgi:uncharacterized protein (DUF433 family)